MSAYWPAETLEALVDPSRPITYGVVKPGDHDGGGVVFVRGGDIFQGRIAIEKLRTITHEVSAKYKRTLLRGGELLISLVGNPGEVAIAPSNLADANIARQVGLIALGSSVSPQYVMYFLMSPLGRAGLGAQMKGSVQIVINLADLRNVQIPLPPFSIQKRIASILSAYDDLIENNTRRIKILEEMAERNYKEWFVDFRFPGHEKVKFVDSELGRIPSGWGVAKLAELYRTSSGGTPSRKHPEYFGGDISWVKTKELLDCHIFSTEERITDRGLKDSSAKIFPAGTLLIAMYGANIGQLGILDIAAATNQACCAVIPSSEHFGTEYIYLSMLERRNELIDLRAGAAQQNINQQNIRMFKLLKPLEAVVGAFNETTRPLIRLIASLERKNQNLRLTRDLLLPKLISGEIDVSDMPEPKEAAAA